MEKYLINVKCDLEGIHNMYKSECIKLKDSYIKKKNLLDKDYLNKLKLFKETPKKSLDKIIIYCDGACPGNGRSNARGGIGAVFLDINKNVIMEKCKKVVSTKPITNNTAEYESLIMALEESIKKNYLNIDIFMDSKLVVEQVKGNYRVKKPHLKKLFEKVCNLKSKLKNVNIFHVRRELNTHADKLANDGLRLN